MKALLVIPAQAFDQAKTRLAPVLDASGRAGFSRACLRHVVRVSRRTAGAKRTLVVSRSGKVLGLARRLGVAALRERRADLNAALGQALRQARALGAGVIAVLHADLPRIGAADLRCLLGAVARRRGAAIAPDRAGLGTNALALRPAHSFRFHFGTQSFARHRSEALRRRLGIRVVRMPGLAFDVDTPRGYLDYSHARGRPGRVS